MAPADILEQFPNTTIQDLSDKTEIEEAIAKLAEFNKDAPDIVPKDPRSIKTGNPSEFCNALRAWDGMTCDY